MTPSFNPRRTSPRLPLHHHQTSSRSLCRRWTLRLLCILCIGFFLWRPWTSDNPTTDGVFPELTLARNAELTSSGARIPKIVHFIHGLKGPDPTLDLAHYIAIKAAHDVIQPDKIYLHYHYQPTGDLFERARPMLTLRKVPLIDNIFGRKVQHFAHRADIVRLEVLREFGGIYFDLDLFALKPIDHLLDEEFVMAQEGQDGSVGLCNAMMMSRPNSRFVQRYYASYATFDMDQWNYHSVVLPGKLARHFQDEISILDYKAFFWPLWDSVGLRTLYLEKSYDFTANLGSHIWESPANKHLMKDVTEETILNVDNSLYCKLRPFLLDGRPDPRADACRILERTERSDQLVGHWPLEKAGIPETSPMRAEDVSGNHVNGLIRNGNHDNNGVQLNGQDSYIFLNVPIKTTIHTLTVSWWMKTSSNKENGTAVAVQTDRAKVYVRTEAVGDLVSLGLTTVLLEDDWSWNVEKVIHANPFPINGDDEYHHFTLVVDDHTEPGQYTLHPALALYMDGYAIASSTEWKLPEGFNPIVRGVWFGSCESEHSNYQDPWDTSVSLEASYRDIRIWERVLDVDEIRNLAPISFANAPGESDKVISSGTI
ncbi:hypothetical protein BJV82DRAFT_671498 [Fennellomyces sp. T-0311]|nr:hypothetical protein BJV82DRAFT_671498 [Fennellomyces sp. T-0311]